MTFSSPRLLSVLFSTDRDLDADLVTQFISGTMPVQLKKGKRRHSCNLLQVFTAVLGIRNDFISDVYPNLKFIPGPVPDLDPA